MMADGASGRSANQAVVTSHMPGYPTYNGTFDAPLCIGCAARASKSKGENHTSQN